MSDARLKSEFWVQACIRRANLAGSVVTVVRRGDADSGSLLIKINRFSAGCEILVETRDPDGALAWFRGTGPSAVDEATADTYLERSRSRDPDIWIIEIEDRTGILPFDGKIL